MVVFRALLLIFVVVAMIGVLGSVICNGPRHRSAQQEEEVVDDTIATTVHHIEGTASPLLLRSRRKTTEAVQIGGMSMLTPHASVEKKLKGPVQVFILMGQSNILGKGAVKGEWEGTLESAVATGKYPFLVDKKSSSNNNNNNWSVRKNVRNIKVTDYYLHKNDWLTAADTKHIGPELGIGKVLGDYLGEDVPILLLKSCTGNRSLGWDLLPPGSRSFKFQGRYYAGYKESPQSWALGETRPESIPWYAGKQYDSDVGSAKTILDNLDRYYPGATRGEYEIAGFLFWQGDKDSFSDGLTSRYERNLKNFIKSVRKDFEAPNAKFVLATQGHVEQGADVANGNEGEILKAQLAVDGGSGKYEEFQNNVKTVYAHPHWHGGTAHMHYQGRAETFMDVGLALGEAMKELLQQTK